MNSFAIQVNGRAVSADVEPRTHLGDFLRDNLRLTGTHLGCEHGVCGACTVLLDGVPARSCITFAVACEGSDVRTIEGYDEDPVMQMLRPAFTRHHALQCGFCTPGMLATARDIVLRVPDADEARAWNSPETSAAAPATSASSMPCSTCCNSSARSPILRFSCCVRRCALRSHAR